MIYAAKWVKNRFYYIIFFNKTLILLKKNEKNIILNGSYHAFWDSVYSKVGCILFKENLDVHVNDVNRSNDDRKLLLNSTIKTELILSFINKHKVSENVLLWGNFNCRLDNE